MMNARVPVRCRHETPARTCRPRLRAAVTCVSIQVVVVQAEVAACGGRVNVIVAQTFSCAHSRCVIPTACAFQSITHCVSEYTYRLNYVAAILEHSLHVKLHAPDGLEHSVS